MLARNLTTIAALAFLFLAACGSDVATSGSFIGCYSTAEGLICVSADQATDLGERDDADGDGAEDDLVCADTGCVEECVDTEWGTRCEISCEGGLECVTECASEDDEEGDDGEEGDEVCERECSCPDVEPVDCEEGDMECFCDRNPEHEECVEPVDCAEGDMECFCDRNPEHEECLACEEGDMECFCDRNPEHEECLVCEEGDMECFCDRNPEHEECQPEPVNCEEDPDHIECFCAENPDHPECTPG